MVPLLLLATITTTTTIPDGGTTPTGTTVTTDATGTSTGAIDSTGTTATADASTDAITTTASVTGAGATASVTGTTAGAATITNATAGANTNPYNLQFHDGIDETTTVFVTAIEGVTGIIESATTMPDIVTTNNHFYTLDFSPDNSLATWWKPGQPCMAVDEDTVILFICIGTFKGK